MCKFLRIENSNLAEMLVKLGFQYVKEGKFYVFVYTEELEKLLKSNEEFSATKCGLTNKLTF